MDRLSRRSFLGLLSAAAFVAVTRPALASTSRLRSATKDALGVTLLLELDHAPFPCAGTPYKDNTVIVFVPNHFRAMRDARVSVVVHFHGHNSSAERAMTNHQLREQLSDSKQDAILVVPQGPLFAPDSSIGKLEAPGGFSRLVNDVIDTMKSDPGVRAALGVTGLDAEAQLGTVCVSAHSGGYHAAACATKDTTIEVNEVWLFDALYAEAESFRTWVIAGKGKSMRQRHKLVNHYGDGTAGQSTQLLRELEQAGVKTVHETIEGTLSRDEITRAEAVFIHSALSHGALTHELNSMRDCLFASGLRRHVRADWFANRVEARQLDRRPSRER
ncbi:MAG: hypothetical protein JWM74_4721 [Myxococcaceae bacterium]|nr:hypothetical protein [Myxococcaceae bacterium]